MDKIMKQKRLENDRLEFSCYKKFALKDYETAANISEEYFQSVSDPDQFQINTANKTWFRERFPISINVIKYAKKVVGVTFVFLSDRLTMKKFIDKKINEDELTEYFKKYYGLKKMDCLYLSGAFIMPEYRGQGLATTALINQLREINKTIKYRNLFYWAYSPEGGMLAKKVARKIHMKSYARKD